MVLASSVGLTLWRRNITKSGRRTGEPKTGLKAQRAHLPHLRWKPPPLQRPRVLVSIPSRIFLHAFSISELILLKPKSCQSNSCLCCTLFPLLFSACSLSLFLCCAAFLPSPLSWRSQLLHRGRWRGRAGRRSESGATAVHRHSCCERMFTQTSLHTDVCDFLWQPKCFYIISCCWKWMTNNQNPAVERCFYASLSPQFASLVFNILSFWVPERNKSNLFLSFSSLSGVLWLFSVISCYSKWIYCLRLCLKL